MAFVFSFGSASEYVPGTPGGPWSEDEVLIVKSKIHTIINGNGCRAMRQLFGQFWDCRSSIGPDAAKFIRLGFHDCLK